MRGARRANRCRLRPRDRGDLKFAVVALSAVFFVIDPLANVPVFLTITSKLTPDQRRDAARRAAFATWVVLCFFAVAGGLVFKAFGISLGAFKVAGGIMLLLMSIDMMRAQPSPTRTTHEEQQESRAQDDVAIFPMAIPMLAGPGAIATVMVLMSRAAWSPVRTPAVFGAITVTCVDRMAADAQRRERRALDPQDVVARVRARDGPAARGGRRRVRREWRTRPRARCLVAVSCSGDEASVGSRRGRGFACAGEPPPPAAPARPSSGAGAMPASRRASRPSSTHDGYATAGKSDAPPDRQGVPRPVRRALQTDAWSAQVRRCFGSIKTLDDGDKCGQMLTDAQREALDMATRPPTNSPEAEPMPPPPPAAEPARRPRHRRRRNQRRRERAVRARSPARVAIRATAATDRRARPGCGDLGLYRDRLLVHEPSRPSPTATGSPAISTSCAE